MQKRILSMFLCMAMLFGIIPIGVSAEEENGGIAEYAVNVATVTLNGSSTETAYSDIEAAFTAAQTRLSLRAMRI